ncbi:uncharacterized protein Jarid2 isoform X2 [Halyomorpha halys]|uniref:uncharacterized protein Jarid2 isoform X2 n=1 Tax=Halyomorpha halys TaxID=286706 RepID=UPI0006D4E3CB|nr:uncharacterized protein LOC106681809 isoform X2 [Halyomorpha halys]
MVFSRSDVKRRNKYAHDPLAENPKRIKVHAQRKFAQGSGMNSPVMTPIKEKEKVKPNGAPSPPELVPIKRPATEDFLTFLCLRGTNVLPPRLDFFNDATFAENPEPSASSVSKPTSASPSGVQKIKTKSSSNQEIKKKILDRRHTVTKGNAMRARTASDERQSIRKKAIELRRIAAQRRSKPIRKTHPAILKRLGAARLRAGLRSGGQLPPGSDAGIKSDRKPRRGRPPRRRRMKVVQKDSVDESPERKGESEDSDEDSDEQPSQVSTMRLRTRGSSNSPAQPPKTLNVSSRPSRKTKEAATLYMEMLTKDLRSPDEEFEGDYIKNLPEASNSTKKEKEEDFKATPPKKTRQQVKDEKNKSGRPHKVVTRINVKEEDDSELDEENEPLLTRTQRTQKKDASKGIAETSNRRRDSLNRSIDRKKAEDSPKNVKRLAGKRELRTLKERKNMNDDNHTTSEDEEEVEEKGFNKKTKEEKLEGRGSIEIINKPVVSKRNEPKKSGTVKQSPKEIKKGKRFSSSKNSIESIDDTVTAKKRKGLEDNEKKVVEHEDTDETNKPKITDRKKTRKLIENEDLAEPKQKPEKRASSLSKEDKTKGAKLSKEATSKVPIKVEKGDESDQDEENEPLLKRSQRMVKKESISSEKKTTPGRTLRSNEPKTEINTKDSPKKRGRKSLKVSKNLDEDSIEDEVPISKPKDVLPKKVLEEKIESKEDVKKEVQKNIVENEKKNVKDVTPKRGRRVSSVKNVNSNCGKEDLKEANVNETSSAGKSNSVFEKGLEITNRVNITELRSKKFNDDSPDSNFSAKARTSKKSFADIKDMDIVNKVKITDLKTKKIVEDEKAIDVINKVKIMDTKVSKNDAVLGDDDKKCDVSGKVKIAEHKVSKKPIVENKGIDVTNKVKLNDHKTTKKTESENEIDIINKVKISDNKALKKLDDEKEEGSNQSYDSKKNKNFDLVDKNLNNTESENLKEIEQKKRKKIVCANSGTSDEKKLKRVTRQSSGGPLDSEEVISETVDIKSNVFEIQQSDSPKEEAEKCQTRRSSLGSKTHSKKDSEGKSLETSTVEKLKVASIGKRKSASDRDSCDTINSESSAIVDCKVVLESLEDPSRDVQRPSKKLKVTSKDINTENSPSNSADDKQLKNNDLIAADYGSNIVLDNSGNSEAELGLEKIEHKDETQKPKHSISETWRQAFKNAKIPKPGQLSPVPHTVKPFVRQKLSNISLLNPSFSNKPAETPDPKGSDANKSQKITSNLSPFKAMLANQNQRSVSPDIKKNSSPVHKINFGGRDSPLKRCDEIKNDYKKQETPVKTFTQLQYEKRSSEFINSISDSVSPILPGFDSIKPFKKEIKKEESKDSKGDISDNLSTASSEPIPKPPPEGKHLNLPLAVEHTLRKMSPVTVSKKPVVVKPVITSMDRKNDSTVLLVKQKHAPTEIKVENPSDISASPSVSASCSLPSRDLMVREPSDISLMAKKKVSMTTEEINRWLNDNTSSGIEHKKDCGILENNQCECGCGFRSCKEGMESSVGVSELVAKDDGKIDHGVVEPPVQLKELDQARKYEAETISTCKVEDYKEKLLTKSSSSESKMAPPKPRKSSGFEKFKSNRSMTDEEMCDFDFRFDRTSTISPRESMSDLSSITPRDDGSSSSDMPERKIFQQRRLGTKRPSLSKSPSAFSAENESSVYAFKPDPPPSKPFRRGRGKSGDNEDGPSSSSIAVQVNIETETEAVLECSTQTDRENDENEGRLFYIPLPVGEVERGLPQGVALKLDTEGPDQRVIMRAKLVTKPANNYSLPSSSSLSKPQKVDEFPQNGTPATLVEAPTFYPTEKEFQDPLEYIEHLTPLAQSFGICRIVPPSSFKPECKVADEMRFTAYNQYVHKMMERWGPNVREMSAIRKYLRTQSISLVQVPSIGSMEVDLPRLYQTVQQCGGLKEVIEKKRWARVADAMRIPKLAQDRVTKLDDIYCKFLLPYDTLSHEERNKLLEEVEDEWKERQKRIAAAEEESGSADNSSDESETDEREECIAKGRSMPLSAFFRTARNTMAMWFKDGAPSAAEVEAEYWKHVSQKMCHVCVHSGSIDCATWGCGFPTTKSSATSRHPWNLKVLTNNPGNILRSLGPVMGITVPTLHVGMLFSSCCWYRDPHALPWIEYLHTGASKIWYGVPDSWCSELRQAMYPLLPRHTRDRTIWLPSDTMMVPPTYLLDGGASVCRVVQEPGQFILVFPKSFTSSISTGYVVSESVYFAQPSWLNTAEQVFKDILDSCEPPVFSFHKLLFNIANDARASAETLIQVLPMVKSVVEQEVESRKKLEKLGLTSWERIPSGKGRRNKKQEEETTDLECDICRGAFFLSMVTNSNEDCSYCIDHAIDVLTKDQSLLKYCKLKFAYDEEEMEELIEKVKNKIETKTQKKLAKEKGSSSGSKN